MNSLKLKQTDKLEVVPVALPIEWDDVKEFRDTGCIVSITHGNKGRRLVHPVTVKLERGFSKADVALLNYIATSLTKQFTALIPRVWESYSLRNLFAHLRRHKTQSKHTPVPYSYYIFKFCEFIHAEPDDLITSLIDAEGDLIPKQVKWIRKQIESWMDELLADGYAPQSIKVAINAVRTWLWVNEVEIGRIALPTGYTKYPTRSPTLEELQRLIDIASLREKVMISMLALSGLRIGTLIELRYGHVREELEKRIVPLCIHIKAEETKGKYADYFTFINEEVVNYLKLYLEERRQGSPSGKIPPEEISDDSPLFRTKEDTEVKPLTYNAAYKTIHNLMLKAGLIKKGEKRRHELNVHSLRKYFKTQLTAKGVPSDYVEFMMGHKISTYNDVKSLGVEKLREIYKRADLSIKPQTKVSKLDMLKEIVRSLGLDPEKVLVKDAILEPKRSIIDESREIEVLQEAGRDWIKRIVMQGDD